MDPDRRIYHFHCSTHNQKSMRNLLNQSQVGGTRDFHHRGEKVAGVGVGGELVVGFGWPKVANI
jgi:hypothetical protein